MNNQKEQEIKLPKLETSDDFITEAINDLTSELTIQRQSLKLKLENLDELVGDLKQCASNIDLEYRDSNTINKTPSKPLQPRIRKLQEIITDISFKLADLDQTNSTLNRTAQHLQHSLTQIVMRPFADIIARLKYTLHDLSIEYNKPVQLQITGAEILVERSILDTLQEPLLRTLRNAFYHSIEDQQTRINLGKPEQGLIEINVTATQNNLVIVVSDDGCGIPVTNNTDVKSTQYITIPFNTLISQLLFIEFNSMLLACPTSSVREVLFITEEQILLQEDQKYLNYQDINIPLIDLGDYLHFSNHLGRRPLNGDEHIATTATSAPTVLIVDYKNQAIAIQIDKCWSEEAVIRQVEGNIPLPIGFSNCTIIGNGQVVPIVNWDELLSSFNNLNQNIPDSSEQSSSQSLHDTIKNDTTKNDSKTILVVEDSTNVRNLLAFTLQKAGYEVEEASDGLKGIEKLQAGSSIKAVICDVDMPKLNGFGFLVRVKAQRAFKHIPIIMLTSHAGEKHRQIAFQLGAKAYLCKPYNEYELLKALNE